MPELLLELFSEEIPARMQAGAARDLARMAAERLRAQELTWDALRTFAGPRRLTLVVDGLPAATPDRSDELKGPKSSAPPQALEGFLRKAGVAREALVERDGVLFATLARPGRPTPEIAAEVVGAIVRDFPWPKSMRSGVSAFRWVRPLKRVLFLFDGAVVPFAVDGVAAADLTEGHRFMGADAGRPLRVTGFDDYRTQLARNLVTLDAAERRATILGVGQANCAMEGLELVPDEGLADEVAGLVEHAVPVLGRMDPAFLDLPGEVIRTSMRTHQKYFAVRKPGETALQPRFVVVANVEASDGGGRIAAGNARVLSARLSDARFFWDEDRRPGAFERWAKKLEGVTFHARLGTVAERVERIAALAREIAPAVGADPDLAERAARLCKLDLASAMVGEFPELQGVMGGYYVRASSPLPSAEGGEAGRGGEGTAVAGSQGDVSADQHDPPAHTPIPGPSPLEGEGRRARDQVADAVRDHYKPVGPSDLVPSAPVTVAVALADKLDTLVGFFAIDEKPTGSKDPYALRRAALGVIRLVLENGVRLPLKRSISGHLSTVLADARSEVRDEGQQPSKLVAVSAGRDLASWRERLLVEAHAGNRWTIHTHNASAVEGELLAFFADRLKIQLRDEGRRHDLVDAVFALGDDDLVRITARVEALSAFLATDDGANLLAGYKRAVNILRAEAKKHPDEVIAPFPFDGGWVGDEGGGSTAAGSQGDVSAGHDPPPAHTPIPDPSPLEGEGRAPEELALAQTLAAVSADLQREVAAEDWTLAMRSLARLRAPVDAFFDRVLVNDPDPAVRLNRLRLLSTIRDAANRVADFSLIQG